MRPTYPQNAHYDCPMQNGCHTFSEWIDSGGNPFTNDTKVLLLAGIHRINSTSENFLTENVHSLTIIGEKFRETTVLCVSSFKFGFNTCENISVSYITFDSCELVLSKHLQEIVLSKITVLSGTVKINHDITSDSYEQACPKENHTSCKVLEHVFVSNSRFINSSIHKKDRFNRHNCF